MPIGLRTLQRPQEVPVTSALLACLDWVIWVYFSLIDVFGVPAQAEMLIFYCHFYHPEISEACGSMGRTS